MICCCSMAGTNACNNCINNNNNVASNTYHYMDLSEHLNSYERGYQQALKDIENERNKSVFN